METNQPTTETSYSKLKLMVWLAVALLVGIPTLNLILNNSPKQSATETTEVPPQPTPPVDNTEYSVLIDAGLQMYNQGNYEASLTPWYKALELQPESPLVLNNIASSLILLGRYDEAINLLNTAIAREPDNQLFKNNLQWALDEKAKQQQ